MSIIDLPVQTGSPDVGFSSNYAYTTFLEGVQIGFRFYTNKPSDAWFFDITDVNFNPLVAGLGLSVGLDLLFPYRSLGADVIPPGILYCADLRAQGDGPGFDPTVSAFENKTHQLRYVTSDHVYPDSQSCLPCSPST
jgi:hypothetical protein